MWHDMRTIVIGDIHHQWYSAEKLLRKVPHDQVVFLGDYFDDYGDNPDIAKDTAKWLAYSLRQPNRIHLMGNHDLPYACSHILCPGYGYDKALAIQEVMTHDLWGQVEFHYWADDWLLTHAGLHPIFCHRPDQDCTREYLRHFLKEQSLGAKMALKAEERHWYFWVGPARGGHDYAVGGLLWLDFRNEFFPIAGLNQIVGHTPVWSGAQHYGVCDGDKYGIAGSMNYCIDTGLRYYALIEDGYCEIIKVPNFKKWLPTPRARHSAMIELGI